MDVSEAIDNDSTIAECTVGQKLSSKCHQGSFYSNKIGLISVSSLSANEKLLIIRRSEVELLDNDQICLHHQAKYLHKYEMSQKSCCNPFEKQNHMVKGGLLKVALAMSEELNKVTKVNVKPGQKICIKCKAKYVSMVEATATSSSEEVDPNASDSLDQSLTALGTSPLKIRRVSSRDKAGYLKKKIERAQNTIAEKIMSVSGMTEDIAQSSRSVECSLCNDYAELIKEMKAKIEISNRSTKVQLLTMAPKSWSIKETAMKFGVSERMVKTARKIKAEKGIGALPDAKIGKPLPKEVTERVKKFYEDDEFSRMCPGKKDYVSVRLDGIKLQKQKRLLLCNLKELYVAYRNKYGAEIGFSKFCDLRPKWCVTVGASGMHSVCVCTVHQNVKLMLQSANIKDDYKMLIEKAVCDLSAKDCMLHRCQNCPGEDAVKVYLEEIFQDWDAEESIEFKQWVHTDHETLETNVLTVENFIEKLSSKIWKLTGHHFVAKHQSEYLKSLKTDLKETELIVLMDFAENYSFVVQDAAQGFHWENSQATVHPFVAYYVDNVDTLQVVNCCMISDKLQHDTVSVHVFIQKFIDFLVTRTKVTKIYYFSDGSAAQYKNYKNFVNLCNHKIDFNIEAEWNFFGTSHGKSPCDGVGGTTKRLAARASLQRPSSDQILTPKDLFDFCDQNINGIKYIFVTKDEIEESKKFQEERWRESSTIAGTREHHQFVPVDLNSVCVSKVSNDTINFVARISNTTILYLKLSELSPGCYIACIYDNKWWIGNVIEVSVEENDALINFMHPPGPAYSFYWPERQDICWIPEQHLICMLPAPSVTSSGRQYQFPETVLKEVACKCNRM